MRRLAYLLPVLLLAFGLLAATGQAQTITGTVEGKVVDQQGAVLPGVTVTMTGPRGAKTTVTDVQGVYRFMGVSPATYVVKVELQGFTAEQKEAIVSMTKTATVDFTMKVGGLTEQVEVVGTASTVDVKSSATDTSVSADLLNYMPIYSSTSTGLLNFAPGINSSSAYGGQASYGNALLLDGVDTRDPEGGSAWTFVNQNLIQEIQVGGLGAPAEYGGFSGGVINTVTKSGGNLFSGLFSDRYTSHKLASSNISSSMVTANPGLASADITTSLMDYTVQMGGPIKKDKAFFFGSIQRYSATYDPIGPLTKSTDISPRFNMKLTLQPTSSDNIMIGAQYDQYNVTGRVGWWAASQATNDATVTEDAPEWVWNFQWRKILNSTTLFETKFTGYTGYYYLDPVDPKPPTYDADTNEYGGGGGGLYYADRARNQVNVSLSKYAEKFGHHSLKFGAEIERSHVRSQYQPYGPAGFYVLTYSGVPAYRVSYGYDVQGDNHRVSAFAQDQWSVGRLTMNLGLRLDHIRGFSPVLKKDVYTPGSAWGPRLGVAYDVTGKASTVVKGFWGRYYEGTASAFYTSATPGIQDYTMTPLHADGSIAGPADVITPAVVYNINSNIKHPQINEFNVAFEQQFTREIKFTATALWRKTDDFVNNVMNSALWSPFQLTNDFTGQPYTAYKWANQSTSNDDFVIRNQAGFQYLTPGGSVIATADPKRDYKSLMLVLSRSMKNRWGYQLSYVLAKGVGNVDNSGEGAWVGGYTWDSPNTLINSYGELTNSRRHEIKAYFDYEVPVADVMVSAVYNGMSGRPYTPYVVLTSKQLGGLPGSSRRTVFLAPRGSERNDFYNNLDMRFEKVFKLDAHRFGVYAEVANIFNIASITSRQGLYPSTTISGAKVLYNAPTGVQGARQVTFGGRWSF